jgi:hypothetical protein
MQAISAVRDGKWRGSTHHLVLNGGDCYVDVRITEDNAGKFGTVSMGGYGACGKFEGEAVPDELIEFAFGPIKTGAGSADRALQGDDAARVRTMLAAALIPLANGKADLLEALADQGLRGGEREGG